MENTFLHFLAGHLQITCEEASGQTGHDRASDRSYGSGAIVHRDMETMKNSGKGGEGGKVIVKRSQTARPAYQLYLLQWETAAGSAFGAFPELNSTVAGSFRAARLQARVVTNEQNFTSIDMERFSRTEEFVIRREQRVLL